MQEQHNVTSELKAKINIIEKRQYKLKQEMADIEKEIAKINLRILQTRQKQCTMINNIKNGWKASKTLFMVRVILIAMILAILVFAFLNNFSMQILTSAIGMTLILIMIAMKYKKYRQLIPFLLLALITAVISNYIGDIQMKWNLLFAALAILSVGLALQAFTSGEVVENKLNEIHREIDKLTENINAKQKTENEESGIDK